MKFDRNFFVTQAFTAEELRGYRDSVKRDLDIARVKQSPEVVFHFAYMALIKIGIYYLAKEGLRVKSRPGHHQKIIETLSTLLDSEEVMILGDKMRKDRNLDFYSAGPLKPVENSDLYLEFVGRLFRQMPTDPPDV